MVGIRLTPGTASFGDDLCTVHIAFKRGFHFELSFCTGAGVLTRLTKAFLQKDPVTCLDVEDTAKEYFNVLCGRVTATLFKTTHISSRLGVPSFSLGEFQPQGCKEQFTLNYVSELGEPVQLICYLPISLEAENGIVRNDSIDSK